MSPYGPHSPALASLVPGWSSSSASASITVTYDIYGHLFPSTEDDAETMAQVQARLLG